jgi:His/Glu/Gln/Arg/opine family amino acid ABC transporter permease subunit
MRETKIRKLCVVGFTAAWLKLRATYPFTTPVKIMGFMDLLPSLLKGTVITLEVLIGAAILAAVMAFSAGWGKVSQVKPIRWISTVYVEIFRGTSALVQLFWLFFVLPQFGVELSPLATAVIGLGLHIGAYGAEVFRGAIKNVPRGQYEAAQSHWPEPGQDHAEDHHSPGRSGHDAAFHQPDGGAAEGDFPGVADYPGRLSPSVGNCCGLPPCERQKS